MFIKFSLVGEITHILYNASIPQLLISIRSIQEIRGGKTVRSDISNISCSREVMMHMGGKIKLEQLVYIEGRMTATSTTSSGKKKKEAVRFFAKEMYIMKYAKENPLAKKDDTDFGIREDEEYDTYEGEPVK